ncbi:MAG TPA: hypothetical protein VFI96_08620, partial [Longimicrobiaceae bacterium]|nr:hypothetical protein [Longimicrobiaceae bacterium]
MMKRSVALLLPLALVACQDLNSPRTPDAALSPSGQLVAMDMAHGPEQVMPGEVLVKVKPGADVADVARAHGLAVAAHGYHDAFTVLRGAVGNERALAARLGQDARVEYAEPNFLRQPTQVDSRLWAFYNPGNLSMSFTRGGSKG